MASEIAPTSFLEPEDFTPCLAICVLLRLGDVLLVPKECRSSRKTDRLLFSFILFFLIKKHVALTFMSLEHVLIMRSLYLAALEM